MTSWKIALIVVAGLALGACANSEYGPKQTAGTLIGGAAGALAGAHIGSGTGQLVATATGALLGAVIGNAVGRDLDKADRLYAARAEQEALEYGAAGSDITWRNPDSGNYGVVTPTRTYQTPAGRYCREYQHTVHIGGEAEQAYGRACRQPDGSWEIVG